MKTTYYVVQINLDRLTSAAWEHIRQCGSTVCKRTDTLRRGFEALRKAGRVVKTPLGYALTGDYLRAFRAGEDLASLTPRE